MLNMKKILVTGTVLTAFCASAFAASADSQPQPSMSERVNAILHENDADRPCPPPAHRMHRQGPKLTPEQRAERQKMREEWKSMTPEQREKAVKKMRKERKEAHEKYAKATMAKLTPAQKAEVQQFIKDDMAQRQARHERLQSMTPEQREAVRANRPLPQRHHKDEFRGYKHNRGEFHGYRHHNAEFPQPPQD
ncbi:MAG: hypothetical protein UDN34_10775 [Phascolarctobacterium succinatutens]|nr:hypothetical protein [Phascolarctobacterium succinatutens]